MSTHTNHAGRIHTHFPINLLLLPDVCSFIFSNLAGLGIKPTSAPSLTSLPIHQSLLYFCGEHKHTSAFYIHVLMKSEPCLMKAWLAYDTDGIPMKYLMLSWILSRKPIYLHGYKLTTLLLTCTQHKKYMLANFTLDFHEFTKKIFKQ